MKKLRPNYGIFLILAILISVSGRVYAIRSELDRYMILRDRMIIERMLKKDSYQSYFEFDFHISSGVKGLISDLQEASDSSDDSVTQQTNIIGVLIKNVNTEKYVDVDLGLALPLPYFKLGTLEFLPNIFYHNNIGTSFSVSNNDSSNPLTAEVSLYFKWDTKLGVNWYLKHRDKNKGKFSLYKLARKDLLISKSSSDIATDNGDILDTDQLDKEEIFYALDYSYTQENVGNELLFQMQELKLKRSSSSQKTSDYPKHPLWHFRYTHFIPIKSYNIAPHAGIHFRSRYSFKEAIYVGAKVYKDNFPFNFITQFDENFLTLIPKFDASWISAYYTVKLPYNNPKEDLWVSSIHALGVNFPF